MKELLARIAEIEDDDEPSVGLSAVTWLDQSIEMEAVLAVKYPQVLERWEIGCDRLYSHGIKRDYGWPLLLTENHPVLWQYQYDMAQAFFYGSSRNPDECVGRLYAAHVHAVGPWIEFDKFFNSPARLTTLLKSGSGLLARAPIPLLETYREALRDLNVEVDIRFPHARSRIAGLQALIIGNSYFVGSGWSANRGGDPSLKLTPRPQSAEPSAKT